MPERFPLTNSQQLIWLGQQLNPNSPLYNSTYSFDIYGAILPDIFRHALYIVADHVDVLRSKIEQVEDQAYHIYTNETPDFFRFEDYSTLSVEEAIDRKDQVIERSNRTAFSLDKGLFSSWLFRIKDDHFVWYVRQHHLITDGWSLELLYKYVEEAYGALLNKDSPSIPLYSYKSFQKEEKTTSQTTEFWKKIADKATEIKLYGKEPIFDLASRRLTIDLGAELSAKVDELVTKPPFVSFGKKLSILNLFTTVIFIYLYKISGQSNLTIGMPTHGRFTKEQKNSVGLFLEFFPLNLEMKGSQRIVEVYDNVRTGILDFLNHADAGSNADTIRGFNVVFNYDSIEFGSFNGFDKTTVHHYADENDPRHNMVIHLQDYDSSGRYRLQIDYKINQITPNQVTFIESEVTGILGALLKDIKVNLDDLKIVYGKEKVHLDELASSSKTVSAFSETVCQYFKKTVEKHPDKIAVRTEGNALTFLELDQQSDALAWQLQNIHNVNVGDVVGVDLDRSNNLLVSFIAIIKCGSIYLPINASFPDDRNRYILDDSGAKLVISDSLKLEKSIPFEIGEKQKHPSAENITGDDKCYMIYTSGTTGKPKGVQIKHKALVNRLLWMRDELEITEQDVILCKTPTTFDVSMWELSLFMITGSTLEVIPAELHQNPEYIKQSIIYNKVSLTHFVPSMLDLFLAVEGLEKIDSLRYVIASGEALKVPQVTTFYERLPSTLYNFYGPTEATIDITFHKCDRDVEYQEIPIGRAVANSETYILDSNGLQVPFGMMGELCLGGIQVAESYHNNPEKSREKFFTRTSISSSKLYRTGDLVSLNEDGELIYKGRVDDQVKIRGIRVELSEIERVICEIEDISNAAVKYVKKDQQEYLIAFYKAAKPISEEHIQSHISSFCPEAMIPGYYLQVEEFPVTANGKIDKGRLAIEEIVSQEKQALLKPRDEFEHLLYDIWADFFGKDIGIQEEFIKLGGHSLMAIKICNRIKTELMIDIPIPTVFMYPTIEKLARHLQHIIEELMKEYD